MIKNLLLTILFSTFSLSNVIEVSPDDIYVEGVQDFVNFNVGFIDFYNTYSNYGDISYQVEDAIVIFVDTGIMEYTFYPTSYKVYDNRISYHLHITDADYLTIYNDFTYDLDYQGRWTNFQNVSIYIDYASLTLPHYVIKAYGLTYSSEVSYRFNNNINFNAPYNKTRAPYITIDNNSGLPRWDKTINLGYFISNSTIYTEMTMVYRRIDGAYPTYFTNNQSTALVGGEENIFKGADGLYYASELIYYNRYTQLSTRVWLRNDTYLGDKYVIANGGTWINSNYTSFTILGDFPNFTKEDKANALEVLGLFNDGSFTAVTPPSSEVTSVFDLLGKAFNSLGGILNITIFPGITLGLLLCIPFFGLVLLFIIGLFKR